MNHHKQSTASVGQAAYDYILDKILTGVWGPGTRLVTRTIASEIGASLNPVREALGRLSSEGLVEHVPGAGAFVHQPTKQEIAHLVGLREAIESHAASEAAKYVTDAELAMLEGICDDWHRIAKLIQANGPDAISAEDSLKWIDNAEQFHRILVDASRNPYLARVIESHRILAKVFNPFRQADQAPSLGVAAQTWANHCRLLRYLRNHDAEAARLLVAKLIRASLSRTLAQIS